MEESGRLHTPAALTLGKEFPVTHKTGGWVGPGNGLDDVKKRNI
jgi:hypothetical protein